MPPPPPSEGQENAIDEDDEENAIDDDDEGNSIDEVEKAAGGLEGSRPWRGICPLPVLTHAWSFLEGANASVFLVGWSRDAT